VPVTAPGSATPGAPSPTTRATAAASTTSRRLTVSSDSYFYNLGDLFWEGRAPTARRHPERGGRSTARGDHRHRPARRGAGAGRQPTGTGEAARRGPTAFPNTTWYTGDNIEMAFGQGETVADTRSSRRWPTATFANGGTRYAPRGGLRDREPDHGQGGQEDRPAGHRAREPPAEPTPSPFSRDSRASSPNRAGRPTPTSRASRRTGTSPARRARRPTPGRSSPTAGSWPSGPTPTPVPRAGRDRPGWVRRRGRGPAGAQHLRLHRDQPDRRCREDADPSSPPSDRCRPATRRSARRPPPPRPRRRRHPVPTTHDDVPATTTTTTTRRPGGG
jgi:hypothetical protein